MRLKADVLEWRTLSGRIVAVDLRSRQVIEVNQSGARMWSELLTGTTRDGLVHSLMEGYAIDSDRAGNDVDSFLRMLKDADLIEDDE